MSWIVSHWSEISLAIGAIASFFAGRRTKRNKEVSDELINLEKVRNIEKTLLADMEDQIKKLIDTNNKLEDIIEKQAKTIRLYEDKFGFLDNGV